ncbi:MAG: hypothetical protein RLO02_00925, partial [Roseitalea porphyridii]
RTSPGFVAGTCGHSSFAAGLRRLLMRPDRAVLARCLWVVDGGLSFKNREFSSFSPKQQAFSARC